MSITPPLYRCSTWVTLRRNYDQGGYNFGWISSLTVIREISGGTGLFIYYFG